MGSGLADVAILALMLTVSCHMFMIVDRFLIGQNKLQSSGCLVWCILTHWMGLCVSLFRLSN